MSTPSPNRSIMIVLAYLWLLALVPLLVDKHDAEVQWHAKHGIVLTVAELVLFFGYIMVTSIVSLATLGLGVGDGLCGGAHGVATVSKLARLLSSCYSSTCCSASTMTSTRSALYGRITRLSSSAPSASSSN